MEPALAFNANGIEGDIPRDGFRIYVQPDGLYFIRIGNLNRITAPSQKGDYAGVPYSILMTFFFDLWSSFPSGKVGEAGGKELLRKMEERPLEERLSADPSNFVLRAEDFTSSGIRPGGGSFWRRGYGTWGFRLKDGRWAVLEFSFDPRSLDGAKMFVVLAGR